MKKYHYYSYTFYFPDSTGSTIASVYIGYKFNFVSKAQIEAAKEAAGVDNRSVMLSCCYLGKMTPDEMKTGLTTQFILARILTRLFDCLKNVINGGKECTGKNVRNVMVKEQSQSHPV